MEKRFFVIIALIISIGFLFSLSVWAVPGLINYQGKVTDPNNISLNGDYDMIFSLYTAENGGEPVWSESQQGVRITDGLFNVQLGAEEDLPEALFDNNQLYLEMTIHNNNTGFNEILSPRQRLTSTPYSMKAGDADTARDADTVDGRHADEFLYASDGTQTRSGGFNITGDVGIGERFGTANPENPFTIDTLRTGTLTLDQLQASKNFSDLLTGGWQSFTVNIDGPLTRVEVLSTSGWSWGTTTLKIYEGEGTDGGLLYTKPYEIGTAPANGLIVFEIPLESAPILSKGSIYTFQIDGANKLVWADFSNPYLNGQSSIGSEYDLWFNTYVNEDYNPGGVIAVTKEGDVGIGTMSPEAKLEVNGTVKATAFTGEGIAPTGSIMMYAGSTAPTGWLICNGSEVTREGYVGLFAVIGTAYGAGNGLTTFNLPDLQQRFPLGKAASGTGGTLGETGGAIDHAHNFALTVNNMPAHAHTFSGSTSATGNHSHQIPIGGTNNLDWSHRTGEPPGADGPSKYWTGIYTAGAGDHSHSFSGGTSSIGSGASVTTDSKNPPYLVINYIIKY